MKYLFEHTEDKFNELTIYRHFGYPYLAHFHSNMEILFIKNGNYHMKINNADLKINAGSIVIVDHYDIHEYLDCTEGEGDCLLIVPEKYLIAFNKRRGNRKLNGHVLHSPELTQKFISMLDGLVVPNQRDEAVASAAVNFIMSVLFKEYSFSERTDDGDDTELLKDILAYIYANYRDDISLSSIAKNLGYTQEHVSRTFHRFFEHGIRDHISELRIEYILSQSNANRDTITELIYSAGFKNPCTYYRQYKKFLARNKNLTGGGSNETFRTQHIRGIYTHVPATNPRGLSESETKK